MAQVSGGNTLLNPREILDKLDITQGMQVADLGCGSAGYFTLVAAEMVGNSGKVYAVDVQKPVLAGVVSASRMAGFNNIETIWSNLEVYGGTKAIKNNSLDIALLINVLFQSKKKVDIIKETSRMVKPGGIILLIDWKLTGAPFGPAPDDRFKKEEAIGWAKQSGLTLKEDFKPGQYHFGLIFNK